MRVMVQLPKQIADYVSKKTKAIKESKAQLLKNDIEDYYHLLDYTRYELEKIFSKIELTFLASVCKDWLYKSDIHPQQALLIQVDNQIKLNRLHEKIPIQVKTLKKKLNQLTSFQAHTLIHLLKDGLAFDSLSDVIQLLSRQEK